MEKIKLSDGRDAEVLSFAIASSGHMFIRVKNLSLEARDVVPGEEDFSIRY